MRIIGGKYKRRRFDVPKSFNARPTTDFAKENLFNVLQQYLDRSLQVLQADVFRYLATAKGGAQYDFIFADPPYKLSEIATLPQLIHDSGLLRTGGVFVVEHPAQYDFSELPYFSERRVYGSVNFSIFTLEDHEEAEEDSAEEP